VTISLPEKISVLRSVGYSVKQHIYFTPSNPNFNYVSVIGFIFLLVQRYSALQYGTVFRPKFALESYLSMITLPAPLMRRPLVLSFTDVLT